jgi:hypothetical protein
VSRSQDDHLLEPICNTGWGDGRLARLPNLLGVKVDENQLWGDSGTQNNELCLRFGEIPKCSYASCVATRPRGVRLRNPIWIKKGS